MKKTVLSLTIYLIMLVVFAGQFVFAEECGQLQKEYIKLAKCWAISTKDEKNSECRDVDYDENNRIDGRDMLIFCEKVKKNKCDPAVFKQCK